ncbi:MAG: dual specificity protein phosphatase family protein [Chloroflexi bacterium]|nr:dual specificity protein phosphatase family protein [Chloroflexota bacterium]
MNYLDQPITEIPFGLQGKAFRSPMPFSSFDPLSLVWNAFVEQGVNVVFVLTEPQEYLVRARRDLPAFYRSEGMDAIHTPIRDFQTPQDISALDASLDIAEEHLRAGKNIAVHCMAGIGRTGIFLACLTKRVLSMDGESAIDWLRQYIPSALENYKQEMFVVDYIPPKQDA